MANDSNYLPGGKAEIKNKNSVSSALDEFLQKIEGQQLKVKRIGKRYENIEDLISDIHENPPTGVIYLNQHKQLGIIPLMRKTYDGKTKVIFGMRYTELDSDKPIDPSYLELRLQENVYPHEEVDGKRVNDNIKREYLLLNRKEFEELEKLTHGEDAIKERERRLKILGEDAKTAEMYKIILRDATRIKASDIHIEPHSSSEVKVRFRVDGVLRDQKYDWMTPERIKPLIQLIKGQADLDHAEHRRPQDGSIVLIPDKEEYKREDMRDKIFVQFDRPKNYN